jgi:hypothetical protein
MDYSEEILAKVRTFGILQYPIEKIVSILNPLNKGQFEEDIRDKDHSLCFMYESGQNTGQFNLDAAEFKLKSAMADQVKAQIEREKKVNLMIEEFLGGPDE